MTDNVQGDISRRATRQKRHAELTDSYLSSSTTTVASEKPTTEPFECTWRGPFRLFDLPSELRLRIFEYALAPREALLLTTTAQKRKAVIPSITPALLRTSHQVYQEASEVLLDQNEVTIVVNAHDVCWPTISENRLPQDVLRRLRHLCVILECTDYFNAGYADVDFEPFEALTSLQSIRIAMIYRRSSPRQSLPSMHIAHLREYNVVAQILERIPASTQLLFATEPVTVQHQAARAIMGRRAVYRSGADEEASAVALEAAANGVPDLVRGCKSGLSKDAFSGSRFLLQKLAGRTFSRV